MGKVDKNQLHLHQQQIQEVRSRTILCDRCSVGLCRIGREFNLKCVVLLIFGLSVLLPAIFWVIPLRSRTGFDAKYAIKISGEAFCP